MSNTTSVGGTSDADSYTVVGSGGSGYVELPAQSTPPASAAAGRCRLYTDTSGDFSIIDDTVYSIAFAIAGITAPRKYTMPDADGALVGADAVQTLTNKTIMSGGGNTVDATSINGFTIDGTPISGQYLRYNGSDWSPQTIAGASPLSFDGTTMTLQVGSVGGVASFTDARFTTPQIINVRTGTVGYGEFNSVAAAIASVTDASTTKRYVIYVGAGIFVEPAFVVPSFVYIRGFNKLATVIRPNAAGITLITASNNCSVEECLLMGLGTSAGSIGLCVDSCTSSYFGNLTVMNFHTCMLFKASTGLCDTLLHEFLYYSPCIYGIVSDGTTATSTAIINVSLSMGRVRGDSGVIQGLRFVGPYSKVSANSIRSVACDAGIGCYIDDEANVELGNSKITNCASGLVIGNVGGAPFLIIRDTLFLGNVVDINMSHPGATGLINGVARRSKITIDPTSSIAVSYTDLDSNANIITGQFFYSPANDAILTETGSLIVNGAPVGCYQGGEVTAGVGLSVDVAAGLGYINATATAEYMLKCDWPLTNVVVVASADNYIYANYTGVFSAISVPSQYENILLARVRTTAVGIEFIDGQLQSNLHPSTRNVISKRETGGPLYVSGSTTTIGVGNVINVTSGVYYYLNNRFAPAGGSPIVWNDYYRDGIGGWTIVAGTAVSPLWDDGTGTLAAIAVGKWARSLLYLVSGGSTEHYLFLYGQALFDSETEAANDAVTTPPNYFTQGVTAIASFTIDDGGAITVRDLRTIRSLTGNGAIATVVNHGALTGLAQDDHLQYLLVNGTRAMGGNLDMGGFDVTNVGLVDGVDVPAHGSRHLPNGADPLTTAAPLASLSSISTNAVGTANSFARSDHSHAIDISGFNLNSLTGTLGVSRGGTGQTALTAGSVLIGNGTGVVDLTKTAPSGAFVGTTDVQLLTNKDLRASSTRFLNDAGTSGVRIVAGIGTGFFADLVFTLGSSYSLSFPALTDQVTTTTNVTTFSNKSITGGSLGNSVSANLLRAVAISATAPTAGQILFATAAAAAQWGDITSIAGILTVAQGGTGAATLTSNGVLVGNGTGVVDTSKAAPVGAFVGTSDTQTLTNKTLTAASTTIQASVGNTITFSPSGVTSLVSVGPATVTLPSGTRTLVALNTTDALTNKTITDPSNTVAAAQIRYSGGTVSTAAASAPTAGQVLTALTATTASWQDPSAVTTVLDSTFAIVDSVDNTKQIRFDAAGTTGTATTLVSQQTANASLMLPGATDTLVGRATVDTLTNKTLTSPIIATIVNVGTLTLPTATDTLVGRSTTDTLANKTLTAASTTISGTGSLLFTAGGTSSTTLASAPSAPNVLTLPTDTDTLVGRNTIDTLTNKTLSMISVSFRDLSSRFYDFTATGTSSTTCTITSALTASRVISMPDISDTLVTKTSTDTFTNKSITGGSGGNVVSADRVRAVVVSTVAPTVGQVLTATTTTDAEWAAVSLSGATGILPVTGGGTGLSSLTSGRVLIGAGTSVVDLTKAAPIGAFVGTTDTQTLSGKTLTSPVIASIVNGGGLLTLPTSTDTLVGRDTSDTLTSKTLSYTTSTIDVNLVTGITITGTPVAGNGIYMTGAPGFAAWGSLNLSTAAATTGTLSVARGGTGAATHTSGNLLTGNGTGAIQSTTVIPSGGLVGVSAAQTLSNKTLNGPSLVIEGPTPGVDGLTLSVFGTDQLIFGGSSTLTMPVGTQTLMGKTTFDTMTNKTITDNSNIVTANSLRVIGGSVDISTTVAPTAGQVLVATSGSAATWQDVTSSGSFDDSNFEIFRTGDPTNVLRFALLGNTGTFTQIVANQTSNITIDLPAVSATLVGRTTTDTLTNKTLTAPVIASIVNVGTLTLPSSTDTLIGRATTDTLTGKTIVSTTNTVAAQQLHNATGTVSVSASAAPSAGQTLVASSGTVAAWATPSVSTVTGTLAVANGGTGVATLTVGGVLVGNGTSPVLTNKAAPSGDFVGTTDTQTLSGKTLTSPTIATIVNVGTLTLPSSTDTLVGRATTDNLTNKTLTNPTIATITNGGTLTLPTGPQTLVGRTTTDTLTNKTLTAPVITTIVNTGTLTLPTSTDTLVGRATTDTLTNKTLTAPVIATIVNGGTLTLPNTTDTIVARATTDTLTNKTIISTTNTVAAQRLHNATGTVDVSASAAPTAGQTLVAVSGTVAAWSAPSVASVTGTLAVGNGGTGTSTLTSGNVLVGNGGGAVIALQPAPTGDFVGTTDSQTLLNKTLTLPAISSIVNGGTLTLPTGPQTLVGRTTTDTLTNKTLTAPVIATIVNTGTLTLPTSTDTLVGRATTDTLTNKTLTLPTIATIDNGGTLTLPTGPQTIVGRTTTDTLTNKTLTAPVIATIVNTGTLTLPTSTDTLVGRATTDTFTNKTIVSTTNTVAAQQLHNATGTVSVSASAAPSAGQTLVASSATVAAWTSVPRSMAAFVYYATSTAATYTNVSANNAAAGFSFPGTTAMGGTITLFQFTASLAGASSYDVRLQDVTNALTIATVTGVNVVASTIWSTTSISNVPTGPANLQIQAIRTGANVAIQMRGWTIMF